jgi:hypothetical protein
MYGKTTLSYRKIITHISQIGKPKCLRSLNLNFSSSLMAVFLVFATLLAYASIEIMMTPDSQEIRQNANPIKRPYETAFTGLLS